MSTYCDYCKEHPEDLLNCNYHDQLYGFPINHDSEFFERLVLEINQAGLSWVTILKKAKNFRAAYDGFDIDIVAGYGDTQIERLLSDSGIIRNRLKIKAAIENARRIKDLQNLHGSYKNWLDIHNNLNRDEWTKLFKNTFVFTGGEIVNEFLMSAGYLPGAHTEECPTYAKIAILNPPWMYRQN